MRRTVRTYLVILSFTIAIQSYSAHAQKQFGGGGYLHAGYSIVSRPAGFPSAMPTPGGPLIGGGGFGYLNRFVLGGTGFGLLGKTFNLNGAENRLTFGGGGFEFGYDLAKKRDVLFNTNLMIGGIGAEYQVKNNTENVVSSHGSLVVGASFHYLRFVIGGLDDTGHGGGMMLGLRLSAWTALNGSTWKDANNNTVSAWPFYSPLGISLGFTFGGGGF